MASWRWRLALGAAASRPPRPRRSTTGATGATQPTGASPLARQATGELARQQAPRAQHLGGSINSWRRLSRTCLRRSSAADSDVQPEFDFELKMDDGHHVFDGIEERQPCSAGGEAACRGSDTVAMWAAQGLSDAIRPARDGLCRFIRVPKFVVLHQV
ncbi:unnamed protein product [Miscanthus lutarioriparius]|uniref:Uncharacterized protein n=1 Tax=Miscanthus lutarioriparius TaxID=422564 RepID=A0A811Q729_9POAL|nr:unnamed protein product [Miscanthus lutarioriparius]